jgi:hypothetical protein
MVSGSTGTPSPITRGPFNGTLTSDNVTLTKYNMEEGKAYRINVEFTSDVLPEPLMVYKDIYIEHPEEFHGKGSTLIHAR